MWWETEDNINNLMTLIVVFGVVHHLGCFLKNKICCQGTRLTQCCPLQANNIMKELWICMKTTFLGLEINSSSWSMAWWWSDGEKTPLNMVPILYIKGVLGKSDVLETDTTLGLSSKSATPLHSHLWKPDQTEILWIPDIVSITYTVSVARATP
jgi:hypothetical protein